MKRFGIIAIVWLVSAAIIVVDAVFYFRQAKKKNMRLYSSSFVKSVSKTILVAPFVAVLVLISWLFTGADSIEKLAKKKMTRKK